MTDRSRVIIAVAAALIATEGVFADLMPVCPLDAGRGRVSRVCEQAQLRGANSYSLFACPFNLSDLNSSPIVPLPETEAEGGTGRATQHGPDLTERSGSLDYCLYALLGLGLCRSGHWVRRSSLGSVPEWYHNAGPFQIGPNLAVSPEILCSVPVRCFVQPDSRVGDSLAPSRLDDTASLCRTSQFAPAVLAARGPPVL